MWTHPRCRGKNRDSNSQILSWVHLRLLSSFLDERGIGRNGGGGGNIVYHQFRDSTVNDR